MSTTNTTLELLEMESIDDLFEYIVTLYAKGSRKLAKMFYNELTGEEKEQALSFYDAALHYEMLDCAGYQEYADFTTFLNN